MNLNVIQGRDDVMTSLKYFVSLITKYSIGNK